MTTRTAKGHDDQGMVLVVVMTAIVLLSVIGVAAFTISAQSITDSTRVRSHTNAFQAASSGLDRIVSVPGTPTVGSYEGTLGVGHYAVTVTQIGSGLFTNRYLYRSVGTAAGATSTVTQYLDHSWTDPWSIQIGGERATMGSAVEFNGSGATLWGPFYIVGDVVMNSGPTIGGGSWYVTGTSATFGPGTKWDAAPQVLFTNPGTTVNGWGIAGWTQGSPVPLLELPFADQAYINGTYALARAESSDNRIGDTTQGSNPVEVVAVGNPVTYQGGAKFPTSPSKPSQSSCYKVVRGTEAAAPPTLWSGGAHTEYTLGTSAFGRPTDDFAYVAATKRLYIQGTVFVDGDLEITEDVTNYEGFGTIVVNGNVTLSGGNKNAPLQPWNAAGVASSLSAANCLGIVAVGTITTGRVPFEGSLFGNKTVSIGQKGEIWGSVHSASILGGAQSVIRVESSVSFELVPPSMPGSTTDTRPEKRTYRKLLGPWTRQ